MTQARLINWQCKFFVQLACKFFWRSIVTCLKHSLKILCNIGHLSNTYPKWFRKFFLQFGNDIGSMFCICNIKQQVKFKLELKVLPEGRLSSTNLAFWLDNILWFVHGHYHSDPQSAHGKLKFGSCGYLTWKTPLNQEHIVAFIASYNNRL